MTSKQMTLRKRCFKPGNIRVHILPILVWLGAIGGIVGLFSYQIKHFEVLGLVQGRNHNLAAVASGRLKAVSFQLFEKVDKGQTLVVLDDTQLQAQLATISAQIQQLMAELVPTEERLVTEAAERENDWIATQRRFSIDVENTRLEILQLKATLEIDRIMLDDLALEVEIAKDLLSKQAIAPYELQKAQLLYKTTAKKIEETQRTLGQAELNLEQSRKRNVEFAARQPRHPSVDNELEIICKSIKVQEKLMDELLSLRGTLTIKSPVEGVISQINKRAGEAVMPGEAIVVVTETKPSEIVVYVNTEQLSNIKEGIAVELMTKNKPYKTARSQITHVGPTMEEVALQLRPDQTIIQWGRPVLIKIPVGMELIPGQLVSVHWL